MDGGLFQTCPLGSIASQFLEIYFRNIQISLFTLSEFDISSQYRRCVNLHFA